MATDSVDTMDQMTRGERFNAEMEAIDNEYEATIRRETAREIAEQLDAEAARYPTQAGTLRAAARDIREKYGVK
jgi:hypothetical protein